MDNLFTETPETKVQETIKNINKVTIQNYRNIEYKEYVLGGNDILLDGKNGIGKTNVLESIYWAISGLLFDGSAKSETQELKPYESNKDVATSVKIEFEHNAFTFERKIEQKWSKDGETYKGFDTTLIVNGAASKNQKTAIISLLTNLGINDFQNRYAQNPTLAKINLFALLYNTNSLKTMDYKEIRAIITDMVGEVDFKDIINENSTKYAKLVEPLKSHGLDLQALKSDTRSKIFDKNTGLEKQKSDIKANIKAFDEKSKVVVDKDQLANAKEEIVKIDKEIVELEKQKNSSSDELIKGIETTITEKQNKIYERKDVLRQEHQEKIDAIQKSSTSKDLESKQTSLNTLRKDRISLTENITEKNPKKAKLAYQLTLKENELTNATAKLAELKVEWTKFKHPETEDIYTCPHCNEKFDIALTEEYKLSLQPKIDDNNKSGKETTKNITGLKEGIETLGIDIEVIDASILKLQKDRNQLDKNIEALGQEIKGLETKVRTEKAELPILDLVNDLHIQSIESQIEVHLARKITVADDRATHILGINTQIGGLNEKRTPLTEIIDLEIAATRYQKDATEARTKLETVNKLLQIQEDISILIKELEKEMYEKLDAKVGKAFGDNFKFKLWKLNVSNGEYDTRLCEVYGKDLYGNFINMKTINTGIYFVRAIEFILAIKEHYKIPKSFVFLDELGSIDADNRKILKGFGQQIFATQMGTSTTVQEIKF